MEELELFIDEVHDLLNEMELSLLSAEKNPNSWQEGMLNAFRAMHTIKANCMYLGYEKVSSSCHFAEGFMANADRSPWRPEPAEFEALFKFVDTLNKFINELSLAGKPNEDIFETWLGLYNTHIQRNGLPYDAE